MKDFIFLVRLFDWDLPAMLWANGKASSWNYAYAWWCKVSFLFIAAEAGIIVERLSRFNLEMWTEEKKKVESAQNADGK